MAIDHLSVGKVVLEIMRDNGRLLDKRIIRTPYLHFLYVGRLEVETTREMVGLRGVE